jgi:hypothetical protein
MISFMFFAAGLVLGAVITAWLVLSDLPDDDDYTGGW